MTTDSVPKWRRITAKVITALAFVLVLVALVVPNELSRLTPWAVLRIPLEGLAGVALMLVLPPKARRITAAVAGALLGVLLIWKFFDMGFHTTLARPFDPVFDWSFLGPGFEFLAGAIGQGGAVAAAIGAAVLAVAVVVLMALAVMRLSRVVVGRRTAATRALAVLGVVWIGAAAFGQPLASRSAVALAYDHARQIGTSLQDAKAYDEEASVDAFRDTPGNELLTGLHGKDVVIAFVESYGQVAIQDPVISPGVDAVLDAGTSKLRAAGFEAKSAFITSSTSGGGSWLAHSTLQSGVLINNQKRYDTFVTGDRFTLSQAFKRAGWKTVGVVPQNMKPWPEGEIYGYDQYYDAHTSGYKGKNFFYARMPDQYTLSAFQRNERARTDRKPVMAEIDLVSSHTPFVPLPQMIDWNAVGDGSIFIPQVENGTKPEAVWNDAGRTRDAYGKSIQYSLNTLISYVETYGDKNLVLVFLGDHQPAPVVTGDGATRNVPVTIVAKDPAVLERTASWGWHDGLNPGQEAPVWPMQAFRDRFLIAFGPHPLAR
ncbi:sulfatase-like hydrolase/transferase [Kibdelosporangium persicum]|uniref:Phosphatidylglycerophosphate synthase n=1 Tax=Kibdelosporangium persicum TaxID=2698649 RepID=A0ABX2F2U0_9PSEU|nr:sulfatase-like hydrolase/transferase [Kibdelosporangium persicum]NRN65636.1 Phosphatidylglycerophosphate synthase [Kibdelosporangium persicum]